MAFALGTTAGAGTITVAQGSAIYASAWANKLTITYDQYQVVAP